MILYLHHTGPLVRYQQGMLRVADLNPEVSTQWKMSRWETLKFGARAIAAALRP